MGALNDIIAAKRNEVAALRRLPLPVIALAEKPAVSLKRAPGGPLSLIAELKFRSPSAGALSRVLDAGQRALAYQQAGASMMSVLCDGPFFDGAYEHLREARKHASIPLLCKEFIIDEIQLHYAAAFGADWALLIVRCLTPSELRSLIEASARLGVTPLVEVHRPQELHIALEAGARVIGVNARDLDTLEMNAEQAAHVLELIPEPLTALHLSGIRTATDIKQLAQTRADGALIGEILMRQDDPRELLKAMVSEARAATTRR
jgi:indole-3-glycerol phosphate synthase